MGNQPPNPEAPSLFGYEASVIRVIDGDTVVLDIDLGWKVWLRKSARMYGINAPEHDTPEGQGAKGWLQARLASGLNVKVRSHGDDKYGRTLVEIYTFNVSSGKWANVNLDAIDAGHAKAYYGEGVKPV